MNNFYRSLALLVNFKLF